MYIKNLKINKKANLTQKIHYNIRKRQIFIQIMNRKKRLFEWLLIKIRWKNFDQWQKSTEKE